MVALLMLIMVVYTLVKALRRVITPLWATIELIAWVVLGAVFWYARLLFGYEVVLTVIVGMLIIVVWSFTRHVRELREDISRLNEEVARRSEEKKTK